jgi:hypothetical protein
VAIGRLIEEQEKPKALDRKRQGAMNRHQKQDVVDSTVSCSQPLTAEVAAHAVGMGVSKYEQAKKVVAAAAADPEKFGDLPERMDETGNVSGTHRAPAGRPAANPSNRPTDSAPTLNDIGPCAR